jgi:hypothetical protein
VPPLSVKLLLVPTHLIQRVYCAVYYMKAQSIEDHSTFSFTCTYPVFSAGSRAGFNTFRHACSVESFTPQLSLPSIVCPGDMGYKVRLHLLDKLNCDAGKPSPHPRLQQSASPQRRMQMQQKAKRVRTLMRKTERRRTTPLLQRSQGTLLPRVYLPSCAERRPLLQRKGQKIYPRRAI